MNEDVVIYPDGSYCNRGKYGSNAKELLAAFGLTQRVAKDRDDIEPVIKRMNGLVFRIFPKPSREAAEIGERISRGIHNSEVIARLRKEAQERHRRIGEDYGVLLAAGKSIAEAARIISKTYGMDYRYVRRLYSHTSKYQHQGEKHHEQKECITR